MSGRARGPGPRSLELLRWIERLEVTGLEPLTLAHRLSPRTAYSHRRAVPRRPGARGLGWLRWIERLACPGLEPLTLAPRLSPRTAYSHVERLADAGLVD